MEAYNLVLLINRSICAPILRIRIILSSSSFAYCFVGNSKTLGCVMMVA